MATRTKSSPPINVPMYLPGSNQMNNAWIEWFNDVSSNLVGLKELSEQDGATASSTGLTGTGATLSVDIDGLTDEDIASDDELMFADTSDSGNLKKTDLVDIFTKSHGIVQIQHTSTSTSQNITDNIPFDDTIPQSDEGAEILTLPVQFRRKGSRYIVFVRGGGYSTAGVNTYALFRDNDSDALITDFVVQTAGTYASQMLFYVGIAEEAFLNTVFKVRAGTSSGTYEFLKYAGADKFGATNTADIFFFEWNDAEGIVVPDPAIT